MYCRQRVDVTVREIDGEIVVLDERTGYIHQLNPSASFIWRLCNGENSSHDIAKMMARAFDVDEAIAAKDTDDTIEKLCNLNLLLPDQDNRGG